MPNKDRGWTEVDAQDAYHLRHHLKWSSKRIAKELHIHVRTVVRYIRKVERGEIPWPPERYRWCAQRPSRHLRSLGWVTCPRCSWRFTIRQGSPLPLPDLWPD